MMEEAAADRIAFVCNNQGKRRIDMAVERTHNGTYGARQPNMPRSLTRIFAQINVGFYRLFGHRMRVQGAQQLLLTTVGAKSGKLRKTPLGWFPDGDNAWLAAATAAGSPNPPP